MYINNSFLLNMSILYGCTTFCWSTGYLHWRIPWIRLLQFLVETYVYISVGQNSGLNGDCSEDIFTQSLWMWPYWEKRAFADVIRNLKWDLSGLPGLDPSLMPSMLIRDRGEMEHKKAMAMWRYKQRLPCRIKLEEARNDSPGVFQQVSVLPTFWFWTYAWQNYKMIHFCCFLPPCFWQFVMTVFINEK
jgi:hypothetical protein